MPIRSYNIIFIVTLVLHFTTYFLPAAGSNFLDWFIEGMSALFANQLSGQLFILAISLLLPAAYLPIVLFRFWSARPVTSPHLSIFTYLLFVIPLFIFIGLVCSERGLNFLYISQYSWAITLLGLFLCLFFKRRALYQQSLKQEEVDMSQHLLE